MYPPRTALVVLAASSFANAWQIPFFSSFAPAPLPSEEVLPEVDNGTTRIAIIGAGAGGSSAAFWIGLAKERLGAKIHVDVYERSDYIGGRSTTVHPYDDPTIGVEELGGSIFVTANKNLMRGAKEFNLTLISLDDREGGPDYGVWDGRQFLVTSKGTWWDSAKLLWRYGLLSPKRAVNHVENFLATFTKIYTPEYQNWASLLELTQALNFTDAISQNTADYFGSLGVGSLFIREMIEAATRVNYAQDSTFIHGLEGSVSMSTDGAHQVKGGNYQIFEQFLKRSGAALHLKTPITTLTKKDVLGKTRWTVATSASEIPIPAYDHVILAAPYQFSDLNLVGSSAVFPHVDYIHLHVTLLSTTSLRPDPAYFGVSWPASDIPGMILTSAEGARNGGPAPEFNSISYHTTFTREGREEHVFKIFSLDHKDDEWLEKVFGKGCLGWVLRKEWDSYPKLPPTTIFPSIKPDEGLWYVNSFEPWISAMETETVSSRNIVDQLLGEAFGQGICPSPTGEQLEDQSDSERIVGWDC